MSQLCFPVLQIGHHFLLAAVSAAERKDVPADDVRIWIRHAARMYGRAENFAAYARSQHLLPVPCPFPS